MLFVQSIKLKYNSEIMSKNKYIYDMDVFELVIRYGKTTENHGKFN